ncbi:Acetyltransferase (GNAT) family protein [Glycomyces sambucus]|uniref:Acetyltransferase (GNAT) family protein n=1 Tax=Glycomyces sambucus TaxID=380244 RepID=A0A1G9HAB5_9ACTN|nr:GNAT family N-acetyltransferase [Glycomyces sambucus]SDL09724.1 Acetyltransferase (GNAT) family protein [Glycomyces sambucus]
MQFTLSRTPYGSPVARALCDEVQAEYVQRYGSGDMTELADADFAPPNGDFLVAYGEDGEPAGCGGWRSHGEDAEMKRVFVRASARRQGLAKRIVAAVEASAAEAGRKRVILETGPRQPEAVAMYELLGYTPVPGFGYYSAEDGSIHLGKELASDLPH